MRQTANALVLAVLIAGTGLAAAEAPVAATQYPRTLPLRDAGFEAFQKLAAGDFGAWKFQGAAGDPAPEAAATGLQGAGLKGGYISQTVDLLPGDAGRYVTLSCLMAGTGTAHVYAATLDKAGQPAKLGEARFRLCEECQPCTFVTPPLPAGAGALSLYVGFEPKKAGQATITKAAATVEGARMLPLKNAGFEESEPGKGAGLPPGWKLPPDKKAAPNSLPEVVSAAHEGKCALRLQGAFLSQEIEIAPGDAGKPVTLSCWAKGAGAGTLQFFFGAAEGEGATRTSTGGDQKAREAAFALTGQYLPYTFTWAKIPERTRYLTVNFGADTATQACLDQVSVAVTQPQETYDDAAATAQVPAGTKLVNVARYANIRTVPYGNLPRRVVDGIVGTGFTPENGPGTATHCYEFIYDQPIEIARLRLTLPSQSFVLLADTAGAGQYDQTLALVPNHKRAGYWGCKEWTWYQKTFWPPVKARAVKLLNYHGVNSLFEFEILVPEDRVAEGLVKEAQPAGGVPELTAGESIAVPAPAAAARYLQGFHVEPWMFDLPGWLQKKPRPQLAEWPAFVTMVKELQRMHCNLVWLFPPRTWEKEREKGVYAYDVMWPSRYEKYSYPENLLRMFCDALHKDGFTVFIQERATYPKAQPPPAGGQDAPWNPFAGAVREMVESGVDGAPLCHDEEYFWMPDPARICKDEKWKRAFAERWKTDEFPEKQGDTELVRKLCLLQYERNAAWLNETAREAKQANPAVKTVTNLMNVDIFNDRWRWGMALDVFGHQADVDYLGTDPYHTREDAFGTYTSSVATKRLMAANRKRQSVVTLNFPWPNEPEDHPLAYWDACPPVSCYGESLSSAMQGGKAFAYWRYNYAFRAGYDKFVEQAFSVLDTVAAWGGRDATVPRDIVVLESRAAEDWWQLKVHCAAGSAGVSPALENAGGTPAVRPDRRDEIRGHVYAKRVEEFLHVNGYPFELAYLDQCDTLPDLAQFRLIILPFPYSLSREAFAKIEQAAGAGTKLLVFDRRGETNEFGTYYDKPLLAGLIEAGKAAFVAEDVPTRGHFLSFDKAVRTPIDQALGERKTLSVERYGCDVQVTCLEKSAQERFVWLLNWDDRQAQPDIGLRMPAGQYKVLLRDLRGATRARLQGKDVFSAQELQRFRVPMEKWAVKVLYVAPQQN
ncbi:MAG: hypothetical protein ABSE73_28045 [Planctomycetota bacterium]